jgi:putative transcriptional regulator
MAQDDGVVRMGAEVTPVIVNRLSRLMGERRLSIQDVADGTGLAYSGLHALYHDKAKRLDVETLNKLCTYFDVPVGDILEWQRDAPDGAQRP